MNTLKRIAINLVVVAGAALILWGISGTVSAFTINTGNSADLSQGEAQLEPPNTVPPTADHLAADTTKNITAPAPIIEPTTQVADSTNSGITEEAAKPTEKLALIPERLVIPAIGLDAPIIPALEKKIAVGEEVFGQWLAPNEYAVGWHTDTAKLGQVGNTVLNGHHNSHGEVFGRLVDLKTGDTIEVYSGKYVFVYQVANILILPERDVDFSRRLENSRWISPTEDERLTLITCWPKITNTHRLIVVASPIAVHEAHSVTSTNQ